MAKIAIIGTGFVGRGWAISFARAGHEIALWDAAAAAPGAALTYIKALLPDLERYGLLDGSRPEEISGRMTIAATLEEALAGAEHVQENTPENLSVKCEIFGRLDSAPRRQRFSRVRPRQSCRRSSPRRSPAARVAWSPIPSIRLI